MEVRGEPRGPVGGEAVLELGVPLDAGSRPGGQARPPRVLASRGKVGRRSAPDELPEGGFRAEAQIRYRSAPAPATVEAGPGRTVRIRFDEPQRAVAPGQSAVVYGEDRVLGGGTIRASQAP